MKTYQPDAVQLNEMGFNPSILLSQGYAFITKYIAMKITLKPILVNFRVSRFKKALSQVMANKVEIIFIEMATSTSVHSIQSHFTILVMPTPTLGNLVTFLTNPVGVTSQQLAEWLVRQTVVTPSTVSNKCVIRDFETVVAIEILSNNTNHDTQSDVASAIDNAPIISLKGGHA